MSITLEAYLIPAEVIMNDSTIDGGGDLDPATEGLMDAAKNMVNKIVGFILKVIDFVAGKAAAMGAALKKMRPMSKKEAIAKMNAALGERDKAIAERDKAIDTKNRYKRDLQDADATADELRKQRAQLTQTVADTSDNARREKIRADRAEDRERDLKRETSAQRTTMLALLKTENMIASLTSKQGPAILSIYKDADKLINMCWKFMERSSTHEENPWNKEALRTTQYKGEDNERLPDRSNADYAQFDHDCERAAQHIADLCKEAQLDKCIVIDVEDRVKLGDALMDKANTLRDYKQKFEKIREQIEKTGFGKEKVKRINSITKNLNYVVSTITTIAASMQKSICVDLKAA